VVDSYEVLIAGGGKAGKTLAADLAHAGRRVALVERGMIGGTCINVGYIPTKSLVKSTKVAALAARRRAQRGCGPTPMINGPVSKSRRSNRRHAWGGGPT
jgi:pyruvate/2-oxoglutarate dehydrogenase complex dihydrolipoamide dehydrogenase (E3) component